MKGTRTKPASTMEFTVTEIHIVPGSNEITVGAISDDLEVKRIHRTVNIQDKIDAQTITRLDAINDLFRKLAAVGLGISPDFVTGDIFTKSD